VIFPVLLILPFFLDFFLLPFINQEMINIIIFTTIIIILCILLGYLAIKLNIKYKSETYIKKKKIAIWAEGKWAFGRIYFSIKKYLSHKYDIDFYDWQDDNLSKKFFEKKWKKYDIILSTPALLEQTKFNDNLPNDFLNKLVITIHTPEITKGSTAQGSRITHFSEYIPQKYINGPIFTGISKDICNIIKNFNINCIFTPTGFDPDYFNPIKIVEQIKIGGFIGMKGRAQTEYVKRENMFSQICEKAHLKTEYIYDKEFTEYKNLYKNIL